MYFQISFYCFLLYFVNVNSFRYINTTIIDYVIDAKTCTKCCKTTSDCVNVCYDQTLTNCNIICNDRCVKNCDFNCYDIYTKNKYLLPNIGNNITHTCNLQIFNDVDDLNKYLEITKKKYPLDSNIHLYLDFETNTCFANNDANKFNYNNILIFVIFANVLHLIF